MGVFLGIVYDLFRISRSAMGITRYSSTALKLHSIKLPFLSKDHKKSKGSLSRIYSIILLLFSDLFFACICSVIYSLFLFHAIRGQIRLYFILASAIGFFIYYFTASKFFISVLEVILFAFKCLIRYVFMITSLPFRLLARIIRKLFSLFASRIIIPLVAEIRYRFAKYRTLRATKSLRRDIRFNI